VSIQPPSDIVLDVAQAADPTKSYEAAQRLARIGATDPSGAAFSGIMQGASPLSHADPLAGIGGRIGSAPGPMNLRMNVADDPQAKAFKGLQALIFQNLFEVALPHDSTMGEGMAADTYRSMMAEQLGKQMSEVVDLGIMPKTGSLHDALEASQHNHKPGQSSGLTFNQRKAFGRSS